MSLGACPFAWGCLSSSEETNHYFKASRLCRTLICLIWPCPSSIAGANHSWSRGWNLKTTTCYPVMSFHSGRSINDSCILSSPSWMHNVCKTGSTTQQLDPEVASEIEIGRKARWMNKSNAHAEISKMKLTGKVPRKTKLHTATVLHGASPLAVEGNCTAGKAVGPWEKQCKQMMSIGFLLCVVIIVMDIWKMDETRLLLPFNGKEKHVTSLI